MCYPCTHCNKCGKFPQPNTCSKCGAVREAGQAVCAQCGHPFPAPPGKPMSSMKQP